MSEKKKWYKSTWFTILTLIFIFPLGLFLMWKYMDWKRWVKILITVLIVIIAIANLTNSAENEDEQKDDDKKQEHKQTDEKNKKEKNVKKKDVEKTGEKLEKSNVKIPKAMTEDKYKDVIRSYQMQIQLTGEDLQKLEFEMNGNGRITNKGKDLVYAIYAGLDSADLILKGGKDKVIPPKKYENDHQNLLEANEHFQNAARSLENYEQTESTDSLDTAITELDIAVENADIDIKNILE